MQRPVYVTGHRNPDTDSIASALGYAELRARLDPDTRYIPVRLGELNAQTRWVLERAGAPEPRQLPHIFLRVRDVMHLDFHHAKVGDAVREVGLTMAQEGLDFLPVIDDDGGLAGVMTERALARRYIRESREVSTLVDTPTSVSAIVKALDGELIGGNDRTVAGRVWVFAMEARWANSGIGAGDVVVVGNREDAQLGAIEAGVGLLAISNGVAPPQSLLDRAAEKDIPVVLSPLDSYVCGRMVTLAAPCRGLMDAEPLTVHPDDLLSDVADLVKDVHYRAAMAIDRGRHPVGVVTRSDFVRPAPRRVILVDHAEEAQSVKGVDTAEIVEILDHHHIGSIETHGPVRATFDPVGSTSTLVLERFLQSHLTPSEPIATMLLGAILSDTVILKSPTTTRRDEAAVGWLERNLDVDHQEFGRAMFEAGSDVADASAEHLVGRDMKEYEVGAGSISIAQVETVGRTLGDRFPELLDALRARHRREGHVLSALMVTDILEQGTTLLVVGDPAPVERALGSDAADGIVDLPGVMSRKKEVAPRLLGAF